VVIVITGMAIVANGNVAQGLAAMVVVAVVLVAMTFAVVPGKTVAAVAVAVSNVAMELAVLPGKTAAAVVVAVVFVAREICCDGTCCDAGEICCDGTCCDSDDCCNDMCDPECCNSDDCADCMTCVAGECVDIECDIIMGDCYKCNETTGECEYSCSDEGCGEICVRDECVPDCDTVGSTCSWTKPPVQSGCPGTAIDDLSCAAGIKGLTCNWILVQSVSNDATGPCKEPGGYCATYEPVLCKDSFVFGMGMVCNCSGTPPLINPEGRTPRSKCPGDSW